MESQWNSWANRPYQKDGMSVEVYYHQFCDWRDEVDTEKYQCTEKSIIDDFIVRMSWDLLLRMYAYPSPPFSLSDAFRRAQFEESIISLEGLTRKIRADKVFDEMSHPISIDTVETRGDENVPDNNVLDVLGVPGFADDNFQLHPKSNELHLNILKPLSESEIKQAYLEGNLSDEAKKDEQSKAYKLVSREIIYPMTAQVIKPLIFAPLTCIGAQNNRWSILMEEGLYSYKLCISRGKNLIDAESWGCKDGISLVDNDVMFLFDPGGRSCSLRSWSLRYLFPLDREVCERIFRFLPKAADMRMPMSATDKNMPHRSSIQTFELIKCKRKNHAPLNDNDVTFCFDPGGCTLSEIHFESSEFYGDQGGLCLAFGLAPNVTDALVNVVNLEPWIREAYGCRDVIDYSGTKKEFVGEGSAQNALTAWSPIDRDFEGRKIDRVMLRNAFECFVVIPPKNVCVCVVDWCAHMACGIALQFRFDMLFVFSPFQIFAPSANYQLTNSAIEDKLRKSVLQGLGHHIFLEHVKGNHRALESGDVALVWMMVCNGSRVEEIRHLFCDTMIMDDKYDADQEPHGSEYLIYKFSVTENVCYVFDPGGSYFFFVIWNREIGNATPVWILMCCKRKFNIKTQPSSQKRMTATSLFEATFVLKFLGSVIDAFEGLLHWELLIATMKIVRVMPLHISYCSSWKDINGEIYLCRMLYLDGWVVLYFQNFGEHSAMKKKLPANTISIQLLYLLPKAMALNMSDGPDEPSSAWMWLEYWPLFHLWMPLAPPIAMRYLRDYKCHIITDVGAYGSVWPDRAMAVEAYAYVKKGNLLDSGDVHLVGPILFGPDTGMQHCCIIEDLIIAACKDYTWRHNLPLLVNNASFLFHCIANHVWKCWLLSSLAHHFIDDTSEDFDAMFCVCENFHGLIPHRRASIMKMVNCSTGMPLLLAKTANRIYFWKPSTTDHVLNIVDVVGVFIGDMTDRYGKDKEEGDVLDNIFGVDSPSVALLINDEGTGKGMRILVDSIVTSISTGDAKLGNYVWDPGLCMLWITPILEDKDVLKGNDLSGSKGFEGISYFVLFIKLFPVLCNYDISNNLMMSYDEVSLIRRLELEYKQG